MFLYVIFYFVFNCIPSSEYDKGRIINNTEILSHVSDKDTLKTKFNLYVTSKENIK